MAHLELPARARAHSRNTELGQVAQHRLRESEAPWLRLFNKTGRGNKKERFVALPHYIMDTAAWRRLSVTARAAWLEFVRIHNSFNNGKIAMSIRMLGKRLGVSKDTADRAIKELLTFGFLEKINAASFIGKRRAAEYRLTHLKDDITGELPSRAFQNIGKVSPHTGNGSDNEELSRQSFYSRMGET